MLSHKAHILLHLYQKRDRTPTLMCFAQRSDGLRHLAPILTQGASAASPHPTRQPSSTLPLMSASPFPHRGQRSLQRQRYLRIVLPGLVTLTYLYPLCQTGDLSFFAHRHSPHRCYLLLSFRCTKFHRSGKEGDTTFRDS